MTTRPVRHWDSELRFKLQFGWQMSETDQHKLPILISVLEQSIIHSSIKSPLRQASAALGGSFCGKNIFYNS